MFTTSASTTLTNTGLIDQRGSAPMFNEGDRSLDGEFIMSALDIQKIVEASVGAYKTKLMQEVDNKIQSFVTDIKLAISQRAQNKVPAPPSLTSIHTVYGTLPKPQAQPYVYQPPQSATVPLAPVSLQPPFIPATPVLINDQNDHNSQNVGQVPFPLPTQTSYASQQYLTQQRNNWSPAQQEIQVPSFQRPVIGTEKQDLQANNQLLDRNYQPQSRSSQSGYLPKATLIPVFQSPPGPPENYSVDPSGHSFLKASSVLLQSGLFDWNIIGHGSRYKLDSKRKRRMDPKLNTIRKYGRKELKRQNIRKILHKARIKHKKSYHTRFRLLKFKPRQKFYHQHPQESDAKRRFDAKLAEKLLECRIVKTIKDKNTKGNL